MDIARQTKTEPLTEVRAYGVVPSDRSLDEHARLREDIQVRGFSVMESVLNGDEVDRLTKVMDRIYAAQCAEVGGEANLKHINDADIVRCMLAYDQEYMDLATHPRLIAGIKALLGENFVLLMQNGVINRPDRVQFQTAWHRDLNYQHWVSTRPLAISTLVTLEDFNDETGGTAFLPASQRFEEFPSDDLTRSLQVTPHVPRGSFIIFDSMTFHRAGVNRSDRVRRGVNHVFGSPILSQQVDIPAMLGKDAPEDPWLAGFLGYRWNPVQDVTAWRLRKINSAAPGVRS